MRESAPACFMHRQPNRLTSLIRHVPPGVVASAARAADAERVGLDGPADLVAAADVGRAEEAARP